MPNPLRRRNQTLNSLSISRSNDMVHSSLAISSPKLTYSFPCTSTTQSGTSRVSRLKVLSKIDDGSAVQFMQNNSISDFMRFKRDNQSQFQTAVVSYRKKFPWSLLQPFLQVDLVSTIHIADKEYFTTLQKVLEPYDCVLYEMIASRESLESRRNPEAKKELKGSHLRGFNFIGYTQRQMAKLLMLDFQLDCLDYQADNWYHADLDLETFKLLQLEKGESFFTFARDMALRDMTLRDMTLRSTEAIVNPTPIREDLGPWRSKLLWASRNVPMPLVGLLIIGGVCVDVGSQGEYPELEALFRLDFVAAMKVFLAKRLTSEFTEVTDDVEEKSVIIGERNAAAIEALHRAIDGGNNKIGILYGGGHMPDLSRRLREELDLVPSEVQWITAWSITNKNLTTTTFPFLKKLAGVNWYQILAFLVLSTVLALDLWFWKIFFGTTVNWISNIASDLFHYVSAL